MTTARTVCAGTTRRARRARRPYARSDGGRAARLSRLRPVGSARPARRGTATSARVVRPRSHQPFIPTRPSLVVCGAGRPGTGGDERRVVGGESVPWFVRGDREPRWQSGRERIRFARVAGSMKGGEILERVRPAPTVRVDVVRFRRERPEHRVDLSTCIVRVIRHRVREHVVDRDEDAPRHRPPAAVSTSESVPDEHMCAERLIPRPCAPAGTIRRHASRRDAPHPHFACDRFQALGCRRQVTIGHRGNARREDVGVPFGIGQVEGEDVCHSVFSVSSIAAHPAAGWCAR